MSDLSDAEKEALLEHEWSVKEDLQTYYCETCGAQRRDKLPPHRKGCAYASVLARLGVEAKPRPTLKPRTVEELAEALGQYVHGSDGDALLAELVALAQKVSP